MIYASRPESVNLAFPRVLCCGGMRPNGFIALPLTAWLAIAASVAFIGMGVAVKVQTSRLDACKRDFAAFQAEVKALGEAAEKAARAKEVADLAKKEKIDNENKRLRANNARLAGELRDARSRRGALSGVPSPANRPNLVCFGRAEYEQAFGRFDKELSGIAQECDERTVDLNSARKWIADVVK